MRDSGFGGRCTSYQYCGRKPTDPQASACGTDYSVMSSVSSSVQISVFLLLVLLAASACGYRVASKNRLDRNLRTLYVSPLENATTTLGVEQILTRAVVAQFVKATSLRVVSSESEADAVLRGVVTSLRASPVTFGRTSFGSTFLVTFNASVTVMKREGNEVLFSQPNFQFQDRYVINPDVENFFSELNPALDRIAEDFAASVVATIREDF